MSGETLDGFEPVLRERLHLLHGLPAPAMASGLPAEDELDRLLAFGAPVQPYAAPLVDVSDLTIDGPHGPIPMRRYQSNETGSGGIVWVHGGAFAFGDLDGPEADIVSRELCVRTDSVVISVDYRLAVDGVRYPIPHDDVHAAWLWASGTSRVSSDESTWTLGGASAGANLALGVALRLRDEGHPLPARLLLAYPLAHFVVPSPDETLRQMLDALPARMRFTAEHIAEINANYAGASGQPGPYAMPGDVDMRGMPPTLIVLSEFDDLRPSGERLALDLRAAGALVTTITERGAPHGHLSIPGLPSAIRSLQSMAAFHSAAQQI